MKQGQRLRLLGAAQQLICAWAWPYSATQYLLGQASTQSGLVGCRELFAGECMITHAFAQAGYQVAEPRDLLYGHGLREPAEQRAVLQQMDELEPGLVFVGLDCRYWTTLTRVNYRTDERKDLLERLRADQEGMILLTEKVFKKQIKAGRHAVLENPDGSALWDHPVIARLKEMKEVMEVRHDACHNGAKESSGEFYVRKRTRLLVTHESFQRVLGRLCPGEHEHLPLEGREAKRAAQCPRLFAQRLLRAYEEATGTSSVDVYVAEGVEDPAGEAPGKEEPDAEFLGAKGITFGDGEARYKKELLSTLRRMHQNLGHPSREDFLRALRLGGASNEDIEAARCLRCSTCQRTRGPQLARPAKVGQVRAFNDDVGIDVIFVEDSARTKYTALSVVELSTTFQAVGLVEDLSPAAIMTTLEQLWLIGRGLPARSTWIAARSSPASAGRR